MKWVCVHVEYDDAYSLMYINLVNGGLLFQAPYSYAGKALSLKRLHHLVRVDSWHFFGVVFPFECIRSIHLLSVSRDHANNTVAGRKLKKIAIASELSSLNFNSSEPNDRLRFVILM